MELSQRIAIVCSRADPASLNIFEHLLKLQEWEEAEGYRSSGAFILLVHEGKQTSLYGIDKHLADLKLHPEIIVFPCRHEAKAALPWFGGHFTGVLGRIDGGKSQLSAAAPFGLRSFLHNISTIAAQSLPEFIVSAEATHHGPVDVATPSFFAEIGSTREQWVNRAAGEATARAILALGSEDLEPEEMPIFLGFGGGHYVQRQTELIFSSRIAFGHMFPTYQVPDLDRGSVKEALSRSNASYAYIDRKSIRSEERERIVRIVEDLGVPILKGKEIRARFPL